jgi:Ca2+-binding RTX toxin-like protein
VDSRSDLVIEVSAEGIDTVEASGSYTLPAHVEHLVLMEGGDWAGGGNSLANRIVGNSAANLLSGGTGADTLEGGAGNDIYVLTDALDTLIDTAGVDTVRTAFSYTLPEFIERGELLGIQPAALTGHAGNNTLIGNPSDNILEGGDGVDTLTGGAGGDGFVIARNVTGGAPDRITDFEPGVDLVMVDLASFGIDPVALKLGSSGALGGDSFVRGVGVRALDPDDYFLFDTASQALLLDRDGSGAQTPVQVALINGVDLGQLSAGDVYLIV